MQVPNQHQLILLIFQNVWNGLMDATLARSIMELSKHAKQPMFAHQIQKNSVKSKSQLLTLKIGALKITMEQLSFKKQVKVPHFVASLKPMLLTFLIHGQKTAKFIWAKMVATTTRCHQTVSKLSHVRLIQVVHFLILHQNVQNTIQNLKNQQRLTKMSLKLSFQAAKFGLMDVISAQSMMTQHLVLAQQKFVHQ
jgi:hypothetical protein